jgi:CubicO group peptidase (beta-lactamase class C family)
MKLILTLVLILTIILNEKVVVAQQLNSEKANYTDSLTNELNRQYEKAHINGFSVAIVNDKEVLYNESFGFADFSSKTKYSSTTIQNLGSVSKTLIGIALLKAQEEGKLLLDDPINKYLPFKVINPNYPDKEITIRQLSTHTSTITDTKYYADYCYVKNKSSITNNDTIKTYRYKFNNPENELSMETFLEKYLTKNGEFNDSNTFLNEIPGSRFEYCNVGAAIAALVIEYATGESYSDYTKNHILKPLKMVNSGWSENDVDMRKHSVLYFHDGTIFPFYHLVTYPDGGLISCSSDISLYLIELIKGYSGQGTLLNKKSYKELFLKQLKEENFSEPREKDYDDEYNSGIFMGFTPKGYIGHTGADPGIIVFMFFNPVTKTGHILMINQRPSNFNDLLNIWRTVEKYENKITK